MSKTPAGTRPPRITIVTRRGCSLCEQSKAALDATGLAYQELAMRPDCSDRTLWAVAGATSVPQVFLDGERLGGVAELHAWLPDEDEPITERAA